MTTLQEYLDEGRVTLSQSETAGVLGIHTQTVSASVARGEIPAVRYGSRVLILVRPLAVQLGVIPPDPQPHDTAAPSSLKAVR